MAWALPACLEKLLEMLSFLATPTDSATTTLRVAAHSSNLS